ncbi:LCP family protein [Leucobacter sp. GX24907]
MAEDMAEDSASWSSARHARLRRSNTWANIARVALTAALVAVFSTVSVAAYAVLALQQKVETVELEGEADTVGAGLQSIDGELTILLVGSDSRNGQSINDGEEGELNDVNLLLHVSADHESATVISFPRDLMVPIPSCPGPNGEPNYYPAMSEQQLNTAIGYGGLPCVVKTVSELTGMDIPYAGLITFDGVIGVSNAIGGVDVCLAQPIVDPKADLDLPAGMNTLVGKDALQFLRTRHGVGDGGDTSRISNQQVFMSALVRQLQSSETLSDPRKVYSLAKAGVENALFSKNMASVPFLQAVAGTVKDIDVDRIGFIQYPTFNHPYEEGRLTPNYDDAQVMLDVVKSGVPFEPGSVGEGVEAGAEDEGAQTPPTEEAPAETTEPSTDGAATEEPATEGGDRVKLPESVTGQLAGNETCSGGRTVF